MNDSDFAILNCPPCVTAASPARTCNTGPGDVTIRCSDDDHRMDHADRS